MDVQIQVNNELYYVENISDKNHFTYIDSFNCENVVCVENERITIKRDSEDHSTLLAIAENSYCEISTAEGNIKFELKDVAINRNFDIISIVYTINDEIKTIKIKYLGDK